MEMEGDDAARVLLILWRTWHVRIRLTHNSEKLNIEGSVTSRETTFDPLRNLALVPVFFVSGTRETFSLGW